MSKEKTGSAAPEKTAETTVTKTEAPVVPGREEVLKAFASDVLEASGRPPEPAKAGETAGEKKPEAVAGKPDALSQSDQGKQAKAESKAEPEWSAEKLAWFAAMEAAKTPEEIAAAQAQQPEFDEAELAWLSSQETAAAATPEGEADHLADDPELKGKLDEATQASINKRIGKEVAKTKAAADKLAQLEADLAKAQEDLAAAAKVTALPMPANAGPLADVDSPEKLAGVAQQAETALDQADDLLAQLEADPDAVAEVLKGAKVALKNADGQEEYSPATMGRFLRTVKANADRTLRREVPRRAQFLKSADAYAGEALTMLPELKDAKSERRKVFDSIIQAAPFLKQYPWWPRAVALQALGLEAWQKMQAAAKPAAAKPKRPIPAKIPSPRAQPAQVRPAKANAVTDETMQAALSGDKKARLKYIQTLVPK
jgi:hypothetical protein